MIDAMFDMPSEGGTSMVITPEFATEKIEKISTLRLQAS
jgi:hypothetical protein